MFNLSLYIILFKVFIRIFVKLYFLTVIFMVKNRVNIIRRVQMSRRGMNIYKRKDGRWEGRFYNGKRKNGKKKYSSVYGSSYTETKEKLVEKLSSLQACTDKLSFSACAANWLTDVEKRVKPSTFANYRFLLERHILPFFERYTMQKLESSDVEQFISEKLSDGKLKRRSGLSKKYLKDIISVVKQITAYAELRHGIQNKIRYISTPKLNKTESETINAEDKAALTSYLINSDKAMDTGILISLYTGMRIGEVCGLKWGDIDLNNGVINVCRTVQRICDGQGSTLLLVGSPKTNSSYRAIPMPKLLLNKLSQMTHDPSEAVITNTAQYSEPQLLRKRFKEVLSVCRIKNVKYHSLRHTFASDCVRLGFDIKALSEILGHSSSAMTLDRYAHTTLETKRMYMERISA